MRNRILENVLISAYYRSCEVHGWSELTRELYALSWSASDGSLMRKLRKGR